jgi:aspartate aminotransferase
MAFSTRIQHLKPEGAYQVLGRAQELEAQGRQIIHLEIGQPDYETFPNIVAAGIRALEEGQTRYTSPAGMPALRKAIAESASRQRHISFSPEQVIVAPGAKPLLLFPALALLDQGDEVIYPDPGFPTYEAVIGIAGGIPVPVPLSEANDFSFDMEAFQSRITSRTRLIILNSPSNPTGGVVPYATLEKVAEAAQKTDAWVLSDEIYSRLAFDGQEVPSIVSLPGMAERTVIVDGFSKTYSMTGWRLGYGIMPVGLAQKVELLATHSVGSTAHFSQIAGIEALLGDQSGAEEMRAVYQGRRDFIVDGLNKISGVSCRKPQGAFYVFPNVKSFKRTSAEIAGYLLEEAGVAVLPGSAFGQFGEGYLRLSYANSLENIAEALDRIEEALSKIGV